MQLSWARLRDVRSLVKFRCGCIVVSHRGGKLSHARLQHCVFCNDVVTDSYVHAFLECSHWENVRDAAVYMQGQIVRRNRRELYAILNCAPSHPSFEEIGALCGALDQAATAFWRRQ